MLKREVEKRRKKKKKEKKKERKRKRREKKEVEEVEKMKREPLTKFKGRRNSLYSSLISAAPSDRVRGGREGREGRGD